METTAPDVEARSAQEVLEHVVERFHPRLAMACSFQKEEAVLLDMLMAIEPEARVFTIDTGVLFDETRTHGGRWRSATARRSRCSTR